MEVKEKRIIMVYGIIIACLAIAIIALRLGNFPELRVVEASPRVII